MNIYRCIEICVDIHIYIYTYMYICNTHVCTSFRVLGSPSAQKSGGEERHGVLRPAGRLRRGPGGGGARHQLLGFQRFPRPKVHPPYGSILYTIGVLESRIGGFDGFEW